MEPRISVLTIGVSDLERSVEFYKNGLGFPTEGIIGEEFEDGAVAFFELQHGVKLAVWPRASMAHDTGQPLTALGTTGFTIGYNVRSKGEVDQVMEQAKTAGAAIVKPARDTSWGGYAGYFQDPDGHLWEIVYNPAWVEV